MHDTNTALFFSVKIKFKTNKKRLLRLCFSKRRGRFQDEIGVTQFSTLFSKYFSAVRISVNLQCQWEIRFFPITKRHTFLGGHILRGNLSVLSIKTYHPLRNK